jgi:TonB family protein
MNAYINYGVESVIILGVMYGLYLFFYRNESNFSFRRGYLYLSLAASLFIPLVHLPQNEFIPSVGQLFPAYYLPELVIGNLSDTEVAAASTSWNITWIGGSVYFIVALLLLAALLIKVGRITSYLKNASKYRKGGFSIIETEEKLPVFSFFNHIVIGNASSFTEAEKAQIIQHELAHIKRLHTYDIFFVEALKIIFWFNPIIYFIRNEFNTIHEYEADQVTLQRADPDSYAALLARVILIAEGFPLASHFNKSLTLKRLNMMRNLRRKIAGWKIVASLPIIILLAVVISCQDQMNEMVSDSYMATELPAQVKSKLETFQQQHPGSKILVIEQNDRGKKTLSEWHEKYGQEQILGGLTLTSQKDLRYFVFFKWDDQVSNLADQTATLDEVFTIVEESAHPQEGMEKFYEAIAQNLQYTESARQQGIEGRVFVEFVVMEDGTLDRFKLLKGIDPILDKEAVTAIQKVSPRWVPGKQRGKIVKQRLVLPITFSLNQGADKSK